MINMKKTLLIFALALLAVSQMAAQDGYLSIDREGVKWVNEKVTVHHGDTTCYYYYYKLSGLDTDSLYISMTGIVSKACYYYTGKSLNVDTDSLIAGLRDDNTGVVTFYRNHAYEKMKEEGRLSFRFDFFTDGGTTIIYSFLTPWAAEMNHFTDCVDYYLDCQEWNHEDYGTEVFLTRDNFYEVEPAMIEGVQCSRFAYVGEQGDTLAYVVEGIGFDSRDMGDLLTPFTRKPDPSADYQEWCGLSHVVKDGQIIYKGMRYRDGALDGIDEVVADKSPRSLDDNYYNLMGQPVGKNLPTLPGIYIHHGNKILVR